MKLSSCQVVFVRQQAEQETCFHQHHSRQHSTKVKPLAGCFKDCVHELLEELPTSLAHLQGYDHSTDK